MASLNFNRLPWYGQVGAFAAIALGAVAAFWSFYAAPARARIAERQAQLTATRVDIARGQRAARNLPAFEQEVAGLEVQLEQLRAVLPEEQDVADLLRRVQGMATESRLAIRGFTPQVVTKQQLHAEWPIGLEIEGTYHDLGAFLERVSKFPRIINVGKFKISARDGQPGATITAECTATTFVLIDPKAPEPEKTKKPKRAARKS
jgi:type IV pilus assembly protein PilO